MSNQYSEVVQTAREYYNSGDADNFYFNIWGGEDIHIGLYRSADEPIADASQRTIETMAQQVEGLGRNTSVIDLGAGYGGTARWMAKRFHCHVTCVNLSEVQNERNRQFNREQNLDELIDVYDASFEDVPLPDGSFDVVWSQDSILHAGDRRKVLDEVDRLLKPDGRFIFTDPMQADDCPPGALKPILDRLHLESLGSFGYYREQARELGWEELSVSDHTEQLVNHYTRVRDELRARRESLASKISGEYVDRMIKGLGHWIDGGSKGYLAWGILSFRKPA